MPQGRAIHRHATTALALCVLYVANLWLTNVLREQLGGLDTIWTSNAFVIGAMLLLPTRWTPAVLAAGFGFQVAVILAFGHPLFDAVGFSVLNVVEAIVVASLARRLRVVRLTTPGRFARLVFLALLPVLVAGAALLGFVVMLMSGEYPVLMTLSRLAAKFLGMSLVLPAILLLGQPGSARAMSPLSMEALASYTLVVILTALVFTPGSPVAVMVMFPAITIIGVRAGPRIVIFAMALVCIVLFSLGVTQTVPQVLVESVTLARKVTMSQVYLAMVFATGIISALVASHEHRLRQIMSHRSKGDRRARARAEAASVAKTDFLATMSHEIRTPLNSIIGFAQVLDLKPDLTDDTRRQIGLIRRSGDALLMVVNDILDFSKVEAGRIELDPKPVDLLAVCHDALSIVAETADQKGLSLELKVEGELGPAYVCDDHRLCQVLLNFLNNAVKFTDIGGVTLTVSASPAGAQDLIRIAIADTGVGIPPRAMASLFQRFSQVDSSVSRTHGGTGLGLAICKGLVELMGGRVWAESVQGAGSTFWLEVPMVRTEPVGQREADSAGPTGVGAHILLVDDHPMNRELGTTVLALLGCTADVACDGREAIASAQARRYDVILMDVHMPGIDGLAATRAIRALPGPVGLTPIIAMSADVLPEQVARMRAAGMVDSVEKPIDIENLHACLARWIGRDVNGAPIAA